MYLNTNNSTSSPRCGFTLVELAVVLIIIALVSGMGLVATLQTLEGARRAQTESKMEAIEKALMAFRNQYNRLPCPGQLSLTDSSSVYGLEAAVPGICYGGSPQADGLGLAIIDIGAPVKGSVPTKTLNLPDEYMFDGWGRRIVYAVDAQLTGTDAFNLVPPNANNCGIQVNDASGNARTGPYIGQNYSPGAVYVLLSHGPNGHGAYINGTNRVSAGSENTDEQTNCQCDSTATMGMFGSTAFVQKEGTEDPTNPRNRFDDIVRFKERWQLMNGEDYIKAVNAKEYQFAFGFTSASIITPQVGFWKRGCAGFFESQTTSISLPATVVSSSNMKGLAFTPDNRYIVAHYEGGATDCAVINIASNPITASAMPNCPIYSAFNHISMSNNGYLAIAAPAAPFVWFYKQSGSTFNPLSSNTSTSHNFLPAAYPGAMPTKMAFSKNAEYLLLTDTSTYATVYGKYDDTTFKAVSLGPSLPAANTIRAIAFSPDGRWLAVATTVPDVKLWQISAGTPFAASGTNPFTVAAASPIVLSATPAAIAFSPDGRYLAVAEVISALYADNISDNIKMYRIDDNTFTSITANIGGVYLDSASTPRDIFFTGDNALVISSVECSVSLLERAGISTYRQHIPPTHPAYVFTLTCSGPTAAGAYR